MTLRRYDTDVLYREAVDAGKLGNHDRAAELYQLLLIQDPANTNLLWMLGHEMLELSSPEVAKSVFDRAINLDRACLPAWLGVGKTFVMLGRLEDAASAFDQFVQYGGGVFGYVYHADALYRLGQYSEVVRVCNNALHIDPNNEEVYLNLGLGLLAMKRYEDAIRALDRAIQLNPNYSHAYVALGNLYDELGRGDSASRCFNMADACGKS